MSSKHQGSTVPAPAMPGFVRSALTTRGLLDAYQARPKYQQTEYLNWIHAAKLNDERRKRLTQMLEELAAGNAFQGKPWEPPAAAPAPAAAAAATPAPTSK
jgi:hypothetical protein